MSVDPTAAASTVPPAGLDPDTGHHHADGMLKLAFGAIGIVFGDIGTSPLYAFRETFAGHHKLALDSVVVHTDKSFVAPLRDLFAKRARRMRR